MTIINKYIVLSVLLLALFSSCQPGKKAHQSRLYLQGIDSAKIEAVKLPEQTIQKGDRLSIIVFSDNPEATAIYNQLQRGGGASPSSSTDVTSLGGGTGAGAGAGSYLVDVQGNILFHSLGPLYIEGLTKPQLMKLLQEKLDTVLKHPYVEVRFLNKRVTVLGEVMKPGVINMPEEQISILDAIALSGDLTIFGRKDNILVVREENGKRTTGRLNIKEPAIYNSGFFYLHSGDMVYIEPDRKKPLGTDQTTVRNISIAATLVSTFAILYSIFRR